MVNQEIFDEIIESSEMFYKKEQNVGDNGANASIYSYYFFNIDEFINLSEKFGEEIVREIRGITFIGGAPFPSISKFFNLNEHDYAVKTEDLPDKILAYEKLDGSLISPVILEESEKKVVFKSKTSFESFQAKLANRLLKEKYPKMEKEIIELIENEGIYPQFELVSPENRIVVPYPETELVLIALRYFNKETSNFDYITDPKFLNQIAKILGVKSARHEIIDKEELLKRQKEEKGIEGWVIVTSKDLVKVKTVWYLEKHKLYSALKNEFEIFKLVINEQIDDLITLINDPSDKKVVIEYVGKIQTYMNELSKHFLNLFNEWKRLGNREFALKYSENAKYIGLFNRYKEKFENGEIGSVIKEIVLKQFKKRKDVVEKFGTINLSSIY